MAISLQDLSSARTHALGVHAKWKRNINIADLIANDEWETVWPDRTAEESPPLVENIYSQALEDKTMSAGAILPRISTDPAKGTRRDAGERNAQLRRRVYLSYWARSELKRNARRFYRDYFHTGLMAGVPWVDFNQPPEKRFPFFMLINPRQVFPLGYDAQERLSSGLVMRQKRMLELEHEWGVDHPAIVAMRTRHKTLFGDDVNIEWAEEIWFFDGTQWAVALGDSQLPSNWQGSPFAPNTAGAVGGGVVVEWLHEPEDHRLDLCPLKVQSRVTVDDQPRGALMDVIPELNVAQNIMAGLLDDLASSIYAPTVLDNIENAEDFGLGAVLLGNGNGTARVMRDRPPVNFEAQQTVRDILERARRQAFEPQQRSGDPGASIVSAKGTVALMGTFNVELASAQSDFETLIADLTSATANFDEEWCEGRKQIWGVEDNNREFSENYDPVSTFKGDYRVRVSYGERAGLDDSNHMIRLATAKNLGGMSLRTFMEKSGIVEDPLQEEREMAIENLTNLFMGGVLAQSIQGGDLSALKNFVEKIDDDTMTVRQAVLESIREIGEIPPDGGGGGQGGPAGRADILRMARSLEKGGIPGSAEGQPQSQIGGDQAQAVDAPALQRGLAQIAPGGN